MKRQRKKLLRQIVLQERIHRESFERRYKETIREKVGLDFGYLRDDELDKEMKDVD